MSDEILEFTEQKPSKAIFSEAITTINNAIAEAQSLGDTVANTASLATVNNGQPSVRTVTICNITEQGLLIFMNRNSGKSQQITHNPLVGLCFYWDTLKLQLNIEGSAIETSAEDADFWWSKQARNFQLSAWVSKVLKKSDNEEYVDQHRTSTKQFFDSCRVPLPDNWTAYRIQPHRIEFWRANWKDTSTRYCYEQHNNQWNKNKSMS